MLQQTRVGVVIPYYLGFLERFPTVEALANGPLDEVLARWSGLGYYRRARQLHQAAQEVVKRGGFPTDSQGLRELPGIGPYTAAAVASMAFDEVVPVMDGNVERVLCRRLGWREDPKRSAVRRRLMVAAEKLLSTERPGDSNQALMELGATVCRPASPDCPACPLKRGCAARRQGDPERYPAPRRRRQVERLELVVVVCEEEGRVLLFRREVFRLDGLRPDGSEDALPGVLDGMWELPNVPLTAPPIATPLADLEQALAQRYGGRWRLEASRRGQVRHSITYRAITLHVHHARFEAEGREIEGCGAEGPEAAWVGADDLPRFATSSMVDKVLNLS
jgi:A/G-specific adenine glycosylase